jgi:ribosome-binding protein aMBF1 (putative translation factor)
MDIDAGGTSTPIAATQVQMEVCPGCQIFKITKATNQEAREEQGAKHYAAETNNTKMDCQTHRS